MVVSRIVQPHHSAALLAFVLSAAAQTACTFLDAHQNFKDIMQAELGRSADDPYAYRNHYRERHISTETLPNGSIEEGFQTGRGPTCITYFEIDPVARKVTGWRYEGTKEDCAIVP